MRSDASGATPTRSFRVSYGILTRKLGFEVYDALITPNVYPSGRDFATASVPITVPAPGLFSTTTGCFHLALSFCPTARAIASAEPPGGNGTMMRTGRVGKSSCARVAPVARAMTNAAMVARIVLRDSVWHVIAVSFVGLLIRVPCSRRLVCAVRRHRSRQRSRAQGARPEGRRRRAGAVRQS